MTTSWNSFIEESLDLGDSEKAGLGVRIEFHTLSWPNLHGRMEFSFLMPYKQPSGWIQIWRLLKQICDESSKSLPHFQAMVIFLQFLIAFDKKLSPDLRRQKLWSYFSENCQVNFAGEWYDLYLTFRLAFGSSMYIEECGGLTVKNDPTLWYQICLWLKHPDSVSLTLWRWRDMHNIWIRMGGSLRIAALGVCFTNLLSSIGNCPV